MFYCLCVVESFNFFDPSTLTVDPCLPRCPAATHFALMGSLVIVVMDPLVQILLQDFDGFIELLAESDLIKLVEQRLVESIANTVCLRTLRLGLSVVDVTHGQIQLIVVMLGFTAVFSATVSEDAQQPHATVFEHGLDPIIEEVCRGDGCLGGIELAAGHLGGAPRRSADRPDQHP